MFTTYPLTKKGLAALAKAHPACAERAARLVAAAEAAPAGLVRVRIPENDIRTGIILTSASNNAFEYEFDSFAADYDDGETSRGGNVSYFHARAVGISHADIVEMSYELVDSEAVFEAGRAVYERAYIRAASDYVLEWLFDEDVPAFVEILIPFSGGKMAASTAAMLSKIAPAGLTGLVSAESIAVYHEVMRDELDDALTPIIHDAVYDASTTLSWGK